MEPELIAHLTTLGYKITLLADYSYGCTRLDGVLMGAQECTAVAEATQKWLINRYYH